MTEARLVRRVRFRAAHHYARADWPEAENRRVFGSQVESHEHDWLVEVRIVGPISETTGFSADLPTVDAALHALLGGWEGGDLNALIPEVVSGEMQPSTESLARWIYQRLADHLSPPVRLHAVAVFESPDLGAQYPA